MKKIIKTLVLAAIIFAAPACYAERYYYEPCPPETRVIVPSCPPRYPYFEDRRYYYYYDPCRKVWIYY